MTKKKILTITLAVFCVFVFMAFVFQIFDTGEVNANGNAQAIGANNDANYKCTVNFRYNDGSLYNSFKVDYGKTISAPTQPSLINYIFIGWYTKPNGSIKYDFANAVTYDLDLYARFTLNAEKITNEITTNYMSSIVKVYAKSYNEILWGLIETSWETSQGSGFCFYAKDGYYYILTNCHVVKKISGYDDVSLVVEDYMGNKYEGKFYKNSNKKGKAISAEYDLACIYFKAKKSEVKPLELEDNNPIVYDDVISLGAPDGQTNAITFGEVAGTKIISLDKTPKYKSNVTFPVIQHSAYIDHGSSGGPILDSNLRVIGVNFAVNTGNKNICYAIPIEKVNEFLDLYVYD